MKIKPFFNADTAIASPAAPAPAPMPAEVITAEPGQSLAYFSKNADGTISVMNAAGNIAAPPPAPAPIKYENDMWQQKQGAPDLGQPPVAPPVDPAAPPVVPPVPEPLNNDRLFVRDPHTGEIVTSLKNDPDAISSQIYGDKVYIRNLHAALDAAGLPRPGESAPRMPKVAQAPPPPPKPVFNPASFHTEVEAIAAETFKDAVAPDGTPIDVKPLAKLVAEAISKATQAQAAEIQELRQERVQEQVISQFNAEVEQIKAVDPRFDVNDPAVQQLHNMYPHESPVQIHQRLMYMEFLHKAKNGGAQPQPQPVPAPVPTNGIHRPDPAMFAAPGGSTQGGVDPWDSNPEVQAALQAHIKTAKQDGRVPSPEALGRVKQFAIQGIQNRIANTGR